MALRYRIEVSKEHAEVAASWEVRVDMGDTELISDFTLTVGGKALNTKCSMGNKACEGADYVALGNPAEDAEVTFVITTNKPDVRSGSDVLRGDREYDEVEWESE